MAGLLTIESTPIFFEMRFKVEFTCNKGLKHSTNTLWWCLFFYLILNRTLMLNSVKY